MENDIEKEENNENVLNMGDAITLIANRQNYTHSDVKNILLGLAWLMEESVKRGKTLKIYGLGKLYSQQIETKDKNGGEPKLAKRHIFRLAKNIRFADRQKP